MTINEIPPIDQKNPCGLLRHLLFRLLVGTSPNFLEGLL